MLAQHALRGRTAARVPAPSTPVGSRRDALAAERIAASETINPRRPRTQPQNMAPVKVKLVIALLTAANADALSPLAPVRAAKRVFLRRGGASPTPRSRPRRDAQKAWGDGIVEIGRIYTAKGDYKAEAVKVLGELYGWDSKMDVLFKPTKAANPAIRLDYDEALSYFVDSASADKPVAEDKGFAIAPWTAVRFDNKKTLFLSDSATAMGEYYFTGTDGSETKVEYTFQYRRAADGSLKIVVHHSSVPFAA